MASLPMVASGGGGLHWDIIELASTANNDRVCGGFWVQDATPYTTLKIGKVWTNASSIGGNKYNDVRNKIGGTHSDAVYSFRVTNSEQTFDITNFTELVVSTDCTLSQQWKSFCFEDVSVY